VPIVVSGISVGGLGVDHRTVFAVSGWWVFVLKVDKLMKYKERGGINCAGCCHWGCCYTGHLNAVDSSIQKY